MVARQCFKSILNISLHNEIQKPSKRPLADLNRDFQRMMVDPTFMIIHNVRSFLTAVTSTAVTPTAVSSHEFN